MNNQELKNIVNIPNAAVVTETVSLYQRNLNTEAANWLRQVEAKSKQLKKSKVVLIAVIKDE